MAASEIDETIQALKNDRTKKYVVNAFLVAYLKKRISTSVANSQIFVFHTLRTLRTTNLLGCLKSGQFKKSFLL